MGNLTELHTTGFPIDFNPAIFWANSCLQKHEFHFLNNLIKKDIARAKKFTYFYKLLMIFVKLVLTLECSGSGANFLDLDIIVSNDIISTKLYDKRDDFLFFLFFHAC